MSELVGLTVKVDKKLKELFFELARSEGVDVSQAIRELMTEAVARGYIVKERKEARKVIEGGARA